MLIKPCNDWKEVLKSEFEKKYFKEMENFLENEYSGKIIYPKKEDIFNAFNLVSFEDLKVVIIGQDPYHNANQAHGLSFSVQDGVKPPPSLVNIFKELELEYNTTMSKDYGNLESWGKQGVLLLNTVLTVEENKPQSHKDIGWVTFTDNVIQIINNKENPVIFMLWGNNAKEKIRFIDCAKHYVLCTTHPSPFSAHRGFLGCGHFKTVNKFLLENGEKPINWLSIKN